MLSWSLDHREHPVAIRVPGIGLVSRPDLAPAEDTDYSAVRYNVVRRGRDVAVLALGDFFELGERVANRLAAEYGIEATLVNPRLQPSSTASSSIALPPSIALSSPSRTASWTVAGASASRAIWHARRCARAPSASPRASPTATTPTSCSLRTA